MPEDAGKKKFIKDFLQQVKGGEGFIEDIWIERVVRPPGSDGEGSVALSLSMRPISNITQLLEDDLKHTFDEGYFAFRFVAAALGSGKTSLLTYLHELTKTKRNYRSLSLVIRFQLSDLLRVGGDHSFSIKLYCHILAHTFWELLHNQNLSPSVREVAKRILSELLEKNQVAELESAKNFKIQFYPKFNKHLLESGVSFEDFFFYVISEVASAEPFFTFVYLTDELDHLQEYPSHIQDTRSLFKALIKGVRQQFSSKVNLLIYLVGTTDNVKGFIAGDSVLESIVDKAVINLHKGYSNELEMIRAKIDGRIEGAYQGYKDFAKAWQEIKNISLNATNNLRKFCQDYASSVMEIHERYFSEAPEQVFEGNARQLIEAECKQLWEKYLKQTAYKLSAVSTTTVLVGHAFDCYVELLHNNKVVARAFGEAKNYELLSGHLQTFEEWLNDVNFKPTTANGHPPDLAFMIAPSCPSLLQRKLEIKNIQFIKSKKVDHSPPPPPPPPPPQNAINMNTADKASLIAAFKGTGIKKTTIDKLITSRQRKSYINLASLASDLNFTAAVRQKLQAKIDQGEICFK
jgi:hypothetical protein